MKNTERKARVVTVTFTTGRFGRKTGHPVTFEIPEPQNAAEQRLQQFVMATLVKRWAYSLIPFTLGNATMMEMARHLFLHGIGSSSTLYGYIVDVHRFCKWLNVQPDQLVNGCRDQDGLPKPKAIAQVRRQLDDFIGYEQASNHSPHTIYNSVRGVKALFRSNSVKLGLAFKLSKRTVYDCRSPTLEELQKVLSVASFRDRVIITMLAVSGLRIGTLVRLQYRHVKNDLEQGITPIHVHVETEITKGKYHSYDTFLNHEAAEYLNAYLKARRKGTDKVPPENIHDKSPLIRMMYHREKSDPMPSYRVSDIVRVLFVKSGIISKKAGTRMYELRSNSLRKFFRSQMAFLGVDRDYIEFMMGHKTDHYLDVKMMGIEHLRHVYQMSGISIWPQPETDKLVILKQTIQKLGLKPEEVLRPEFLTQPHP